MESLLKSLNNLPAMSAGMYSRFTVILYQLVKKYYGEIDAQIVSTGEGIAVLALNSFIVNPYAGITLDYSRNYKEGVDYFLETEIPRSNEVLSFIKNFSEVLKDLTTAIPLTVENVAHRQSRFYAESLAVDVHPPFSTKVHPRGGSWGRTWSHRLKRYTPLPWLVDGTDVPTVLESKFYFPRDTGGATYGVELVCCNNALEVEIIDTEAITCTGTEECVVGSFDPTIHFVSSGGITPAGLYKPCCNLDALPEILTHGDFAAGGLFTFGSAPQTIRYKVFSKGNQPVILDPRYPVFTMRLKIDGLTVHPLTEAEEANVDIPLQK